MCIFLAVQLDDSPLWKGVQHVLREQIEPPKSNCSLADELIEKCWPVISNPGTQKISFPAGYMLFPGLELFYHLENSIFSLQSGFRVEVLPFYHEIYILFRGHWFHVFSE